MISTVGGGSVRSTVLTLEADGLVGEEMADARVAGSKDGETNDDTCVHVSFRVLPYGIVFCNAPRGHNSAGMFLSRRRRWETV